MNHLAEICISLGLLLFVWVQIGRLRRDAFRFDVRSYRDELFDFVLQNGLSFQDPGDLAARRMLNGLLNVSNAFSLIYLAVGDHYYNVRLASGYAAPVSIGSKSPALDAKLEQVRKSAASRVVQFLFLEGIFGLFIRAAFLVLKTVVRSVAPKQSALNYADMFLCQTYTLEAQSA